MWRLLAITVAFLCAAAEPPTLRIPRVRRPPRIPEFLSGPPRDSACVEGFRQYEPGDGVPISEKTSACVSYDDRNLYVVFLCTDDPRQVRGRMSKREDIEGDDHVVLNLDTFHDHHRAYTFQANPLGIQADFIFTEGQAPDFSFDTLWHSDGRLTRDGYVVLMAIPFKSLRFPNAPAQNWGIGLGRSITRKNEYATWPRVTKRLESYLAQLATLEGLEQVSPGRNLQLIPYGMFARSRYLDTAAPAFRDNTERRAGLDAKAVLRDVVTVDVTVNPDFSQVESDEPQVTVNQRFEVFFPERRPFFIENAGFFETPIQAAGFSEPAPLLFFSRRIADPRLGLRMTAKAGSWVVGALGIDDRAPAAGRAGIGVVRLRRDLPGQSSIGTLFMTRNLGNQSNRVYSIDTRLRLNPNWLFSGQLLRSETHEAGRRPVSGPASYARLEHTGRHFRYFTRYLDLSPDFGSELGYIRRVDIRQAELYAGYQWWPEHGRVLSFRPDMAALVNWDHKGRVQDWSAGAGFLIEFPRQTRFSAGRSEDYELFRGIGFRKHSTGASLTTEWLKWLAISARYNRARSVNYVPPEGMAAFSAKTQDAQFGFTLRPVPRLRFSQNYLYSVARARETSIFHNHILRSKLNYQFTRRLSIRTILDYNAVLTNPALIALERTKRFTGDVLLTYLVNPGTALYAGYTDRYENLELTRTAPSVLRRTASPYSSTGRQVFVKLSYLFRF